MVDFAVNAGPFIDAEIKVVAASVDPVDNVAALKAALRVGFPMYAEVDAASVAEATGAHIETGDRTLVQATGFLVRPDGKLAAAVYSTGPAGRLRPEDVLRIVSFARRQQRGS